jgi:hypothetical protein
MTLPFHDRLMPYLEDDAIDRIRRYVHGTGEDLFTGAWFDTYPDPPTVTSAVGGAPNQIGPSDVVATTMLAIEVRPSSRSGFQPRKILQLAERSARVSELLSDLPTDADLHGLNPDEFNWLLDREDSPGVELWHLLRGDIGLPRVATYKLLARKRPRLLPIRDRVLSDALSNADPWWSPWWQTLRNSPDLVARLQDLRDAAEAPSLSLLRIADVSVWMKDR